MTGGTQRAVDLASWENEGGPPLQAERQRDRLDWGRFAARFYPDARRHDYPPLAAYMAYRKRWSTRGESVRQHLGRPRSVGD
jgi:hypothetical protein